MAEVKPTTTTNTFLSSFFGTGGTGSSLVNYAGSIGLNILSNKGKEIEAEYKTELAKLANESSLTKAEFETKLAAINAARTTQLQELSNERSKSNLIGIGVIVLGIGILVTVVVLALKRK